MFKQILIQSSVYAAVCLSLLLVGSIAQGVYLVVLGYQNMILDSAGLLLIIAAVHFILLVTNSYTLRIKKVYILPVFFLVIYALGYYTGFFYAPEMQRYGEDPYFLFFMPSTLVCGIFFIAQGFIYGLAELLQSETIAVHDYYIIMGSLFVVGYMFTINLIAASKYSLSLQRKLF